MKTQMQLTKNTSDAARRSLDRLVRAMRYANRKYLAYITKAEAAEADARSGDRWWNEKHADYWKGRRDGLRQAYASIGPNHVI